MPEQPDRADRVDREQFLASGKACSRGKHVADAERVVHAGREQEPHRADRQVMHAERLISSGEERDVHHRGGAADEEVADKLKGGYRNRLYFRMHQMARTPSFQPIFLPSS